MTRPLIIASIILALVCAAVLLATPDVPQW